jgi:hypothetical protein
MNFKAPNEASTHVLLVVEVMDQRELQAMMCQSSMISAQLYQCSPNCEWYRSLSVSVISPGLRPLLKAGSLPHFHT